MSMRFICVGDLHLGRRPRQLPPILEDHGLPHHRLTPAAAWRELVEHVVSRDSSGRYDAVILLGDVVHSENEYFEAYGHLEEGARRLVEAGVPVYAIAGNHDVQVLPRLAGHLPGFTVIGAGGKWERVPLSKDGRPFLHLLGWSFPAREVPWSPLDTLPGPATDGLPEIGLLHAHLDAGLGRVRAGRQGRG